ncbi:MAG: recombinase family protein [Rubrobacteraceae bacterium]
MPSLNGHGPKRAILYARVSTDEQARSGFSLAQQLDALRAYAAREGFEVLEEIRDPGQSGASLERPGMDRVRDLVAKGGVAVVFAQDRDRFAREPAYLYLLREEFAEHGTTLRAMNDRGDDSPEGELTDGILDQLAKFERAKIAERSRRGKLQKAREGKIMVCRKPRYGFKTNGQAKPEAFEIDEETMPVVRRIFHMVGVEGLSHHAISRILQDEGIPTPAGGRAWDRTFFPRCINDDVYKPHTFEEVAEKVSPEVASRLDPEKQYGLWVYNRLGSATRQVSEPSENGNGRRYKKQVKFTRKPEDEWIYIPVPDSGIPREVVEAARERIKDNRAPSNAGRRFWELSGGVIHCAVCERKMGHHSVLARNKRYHYHYYRCRAKLYVGGDCLHNKNIKAEEIESQIWEFVSGLLLDPERLSAGLEAMIESERDALHGDPEREEKVWLDKITETDTKRLRYQEMAAENLITFEELRARLAEIEEARSVAVRNLANLRARRERIESLEQDKASLLESYADMMPEALADLTGEERHRIYQMLRLKVYVGREGGVEVSGVMGDAVDPVCRPEHSRWFTLVATAGFSGG